MNTRLDLLQLVPIKGSFVEVGTRKGELASEIIKARPDIKLICVDNWLPPFDKDFDTAKQTLQDKAIILKMSSGQAAETVNEFDMVYIDADHTYQSVLDDLNAWWPRVKSGGHICGHDFEDKPKDSGWHTEISVAAAVTSWLCDKSELKLHVIKEDAPSFFIRKP